MLSPSDSRFSLPISLSLSLSLSVCLSVYLSLSIFLFLSLSVCLSVYFSLSLSLSISISQLARRLGAKWKETSGAERERRGKACLFLLYLIRFAGLPKFVRGSALGTLSDSIFVRRY